MRISWELCVDTNYAHKATGQRCVSGGVVSVLVPVYRFIQDADITD